MNKETKEILNYMKQYVKEPNAPDYNGEYPQPWEITIEEVQCILDYIANLQKENEELKDRYERCKKQKIKVENACSNYKYKLDKTIEYNKEIIKVLLSCSSYEKDKVENMLYKQEDILRGEDNECKRNV